MRWRPGGRQSTRVPTFGRCGTASCCVPDRCSSGCPPAHVKALLSRDGGTCPDDGTPLDFDPWSAHEHRCSQCGRSWSGERHHAHWARAQHLWLAERAAHLATVHAVHGDPDCAARARELLAAYYGRYFGAPNRDNVLGPSHLFFSTTSNRSGSSHTSPRPPSSASCGRSTMPTSMPSARSPMNLRG